MQKSNYSDYNDLLLKCQKNGKYRLFTFDIKNSKKMNTPTNYVAHYDMCFIIERVYQDLLTLQEELGIQILINDEGYQRFFDYPKIRNCGQMPWDWFMFGDTVGITIHNNSIPREVVYKIFELNEKQMNLDYKFHKSDLVYETDDYGKGNEEYFRGYAFLTCSNLHKENNKKLKKIIDEMKKTTKIDESEIEYYMNIITKEHKNAIQNAISALSKNAGYHSRSLMYENGNYNYKFMGNEDYGYVYEKTKKK